MTKHFDSEQRPRRIQIAQPMTGEAEWLAMRDTLESGWLTHGPKVDAFETAFAARHKVPYAAATTSATTGLHLAVAALGIGPGDEVIVPSFTWVATANCVSYAGATPVLCDIDLATYNLDVTDVMRRITPRTKAVIAVHLFGLCADVNPLRAALPGDVRIIEDAACAAGATYGNTPAGGLGDVAVFSFHPRKSITTGEGGMVTTRDAELINQVRRLRNHGASVSEQERHHGPQPYLLPEFNVLGFNYRMTDLQGAVGCVQLVRLDEFIDQRAQWAAWYRDALRDIAWLRLPDEPAAGRHAWQAFVAQVDASKAPRPRNEIMAQLNAKGISTRPGTHAIHMLGYYRDRFGYAPEDFPQSREADLNSMAIPLHNRMTDDDFNYVVEALRQL